MAINEQEREDLLSEGRTMPLRGETVIDGTTIIAGFRHGMQLSLYCGNDPVFQFNKSRQLRRVYHDGERFAAAGGKLVRLDRGTRGGRVHFERVPLDETQTKQSLAVMSDWLDILQRCVESAETQWRVVETTPDQFLRELKQWFKAMNAQPTIAPSPNA